MYPLFIAFIDKIALKMYLHKALPKELNSLKNTSFEIKKKASPQQKLVSPRINKQGSNAAIIKHSSSEKSNIHHISSKEKPYVSSIEKNSIKVGVAPKPIYSICHKKTQDIGLKDDHRESPIKKQKSGRIPQPKKEIVLCRMENKIVKSVSSPFYYSDLSVIEPSQCHIYQGQSKNNGVRHGFGTQYYINGQKYIGQFSENKAEGQGTYYGLKKKVMGVWQENKLKQILVQL